MQAIRAFVGHSFSSQDKELVRSFLEHFQNLAKAYPQFSWDHAEEAEPLPLSEKVLAKIEGKNVFIGICTKNERVVRDALLSATFFNGSILKAKASDLRWKASDWIIQEIGLAVGRGMSLIVFLEDDVREPGGLHGDIEYIRFSRLNPHACFDKFLQMLVSLTPKETTGAESETKGSSPETKSDVVEPAGNDWEPAPDWTKEKYEDAMVRMIIDDNMTGLNKITASFRASQFAQGDAVDEWDARTEWLRLMLSEQADFDKLKRLAEEKPQNSTLNHYLGRAYSQLGEAANAAKALIQAGLAAEDEKDKISYQADAAIQYMEAGQIDLSLEMFEKLKADVNGKSELQQLLLVRLRDLARGLKDEEYELAVLEQMVALQPANTHLRFQLAYKHSDNDNNNDMAFHHYTKIPAPQRDATTWNNLGVSLTEFDMPVKGVSAYLRSEGEGETLAMANIGFKLLSAGFIEEAKQRAVKATAIDDYHENINDLLKRLKEAPEEENKKQKDVLEKVKAKAAFYRQLGEAAGAVAPSEIAQRWESSDGMLEAKIIGTAVRFVGAVERDANVLAGILAGQNLPRQKVIHRTQITARMRGKMLIGEVKRSRDGEQPTIASEFLNTKILVAMYFNADHSVIHVMERHGSAVPRFYDFKRAP